MQAMQLDDKNNRVYNFEGHSYVEMGISWLEFSPKGWIQIKQIEIESVENFKVKLGNPIYPTPPLGQDMTHGQFLSGV